MYIHTHIHTHTYTHTYTHAYTHSHIHTYIHTYIHTHTYIHAHTYTHIYRHTHIPYSAIIRQGKILAKVYCEGMVRKYLTNLNLNKIICAYELIMLFTRLKNYA